MKTTIPSIDDIQETCIFELMLDQAYERVNAGLKEIQMIHQARMRANELDN